MTRTYALANQKGGVGKTTTAVNLGAYLSSVGLKVLIIDVDPQCNATSSLSIARNEVGLSSYDALVERYPLSEIVIPTQWKRLFLVPSSSDLAAADVELVSEEGRECLLQRSLASASETYDYVLVDCPPSLGLLTVNALTAAQDGVIIPVQCEYLALEGLSDLLKTIQMVRTGLNRRLRVRGLLMTMYDARTNLSQQVVEEVRKHFGKQVFRTIIPRNVRLGEAPSYGEPIMAYAPSSSGARAYQNLTVELLQGDGWQIPQSHDPVKGE